jgi:hypothetical protein
MKNRCIIQVAVFFGLIAMSPSVLSKESANNRVQDLIRIENSVNFDKLNIELKKVNALYKAKKFDELGLIKDSFIRTVEKFEHELASGRITLRHKYQKDDVALARSYKESFSTVWDALLGKYGHKPKSVVVEKVAQKIKTPESTEKELIESGEFNIPENKPFELSDLKNLSESSTVDPSIFEDDVDRLNEEVLKEEITSLDFGVVEYLMDNYFKEKYKRNPPKAPEFLLTEEKKTKLAADKTKKEADEKDAIAKSEAEARRLLLEKIKTVKEEERQIISKEVEKVRIIRENQARFEITKMNEDEKIAPIEVKPSRSKIVNTRDRLLDEDDDVIILTVPSIN